MRIGKCIYKPSRSESEVDGIAHVSPTDALTLGVAGVCAGRLIFGLGGECVVVGQSAFVSAWFKVTSCLHPLFQEHVHT
jgi:hypothetical protein